MVGGQRGDHVQRAAQSRGTGQAAGNVGGHFGDGAQQVHRAGGGDAAGAGRQVPREFVQKPAVAPVWCTQGAIKIDD